MTLNLLVSIWLLTITFSWEKPLLSDFDLLFVELNFMHKILKGNRHCDFPKKKHIHCTS